MSLLNYLPRRLRDNVGLSAEFGRRRRGRQARLPVMWIGWLVLAVGLCVPMAIAIDPVFGANPIPTSSQVWVVARTFTHVGSSSWMYGLLAVLLAVVFLLDWRKYAGRARLRIHTAAATVLYFILSIGLCEIFVTVVKQVVGRARPRLFETVGAWGRDGLALDSSYTSFPSGHAASIGAACAALALLSPRLRIAAILVAVWVSFTRVVIGVHYPSDVVAGLMTGAWMAYAVAVFFAGRGLLFAAVPGRLPVPRLSLRAIGLGSARPSRPPP